MTKDELIGKLQMVYIGDRNALNELIGYYDGLKQGIEELQQENKILKENAENNDKVVDKVNWKNQLLKKENEQLKDNWDKLKIWLEEYNISNERWYSNELSNHDREYFKKDYLDCKFFINKFIDKMQKLENETANNCNDCKQCKGSDSNVED